MLIQHNITILEGNIHLKSQKIMQYPLIYLLIIPKKDKNINSMRLL